MKLSNFMRMPAAAALSTALVLGLVAPAASAVSDAKTEEELLEQLKSGMIGGRAEVERKVTRFRRKSSDEQQRLLEEARERRDALQKQSQELEEITREKKKIYEAKINELRASLGPSASMFGTLQEYSKELIGVFRNSPTSMEYRGRDVWLAEFIARMEKASEIYSIEELEQLWILLQQEITASGQIVSLDTEVLGETGDRETREVVRVGKFVLVGNDPQPNYLAWQAEGQRASVLKRQPEGNYLEQIDTYFNSDDDVQTLGIDPTGGSLLTRLVDAPSLRDRIDHGGLIGYLILALGAVGVAIAIVKLISILIVSGLVAAQRRNMDKPSANNPLGRMLKVYEDNKDIDIETLEMRLGEAILVERPKIDRFVGVIKVIATVAPLMGLMGTVIGMIATFQAITLFGTGDPKTMAGGISQALVTTVEGLTVAIPTVLLHAIVSARATALINTLKHQTAGLIAERMEKDAAAA